MNDSNTALATYARTALTAITPQSLDDIMKFAELVAKSGIKPASLKTAADVAIVLLKGNELGMTPMQALSEIVVVEGRPTITAGAIQALVLNSGLAEYWQIIETTSERCTIETKRRGARAPVSITWDMERAKKITFQQWVGPENSRQKVTKALTEKDNWKNYTSAMLRSRCGSELANAVYPDVVRGMYTPDEVDVFTTLDGDTGEVISGSRAATPAAAAVMPDVGARLAAARQAAAAESAPVEPVTVEAAPAERKPAPTPPSSPAVAEAKPSAKDAVAALHARATQEAEAHPWWAPFWRAIATDGFATTPALQRAVSSMVEALEAGLEPVDVLSAEVMKTCRNLAKWPCPGLRDVLELHVRVVGGDPKWVGALSADGVKALLVTLLEAPPHARGEILQAGRGSDAPAPTPTAEAPAQADQADAEKRLKKLIGTLWPSIVTDNERAEQVRQEIAKVGVLDLLEEADGLKSDAAKRAVLASFLPALYGLAV